MTTRIVAAASALLIAGGLDRAAGQRSRANAAPARAYDVLIRDGTVVDGTGRPRIRADVGIRGDTITDIAPDLPGTATRVINATGLIVSPGFIDMHSHSDSALIEDGRESSFVHQGITTELLGEHTSAGPILGKAEKGIFSLTDDATTKAPPPMWTTLAGYFDALSKHGTSTNVMSYVASGQVRAAVLGYENRPPTPGELAQMKQLVGQAMQQGAVGLSSGLAYVPNIYASTEELIELAKVAGAHGGFYGSHLRASRPEDPLSGLKEAIRIGKEAHLPVEIIHINSTAGARIAEFAAAIDAARSRGLDITANWYPYIAGMSFLRSLLPPWAQEGGTAAMLARLADPPVRDRIQAELGPPTAERWQRTIVSSANRALDGKTLAELAAERRVPPAVALMNAVREEKGFGFYISFGNTEENLIRALVLPWVHVGSDGAAVAVEGYRGGKPHPRFFGTFPRVLGRYVREQHALTLEEAVRKMTLGSATRLRLADRGKLATGWKADIAVFGPDTVIDRATFESPLQYPAGIEYVLVNGAIVIDGGKHTGARPGRVLRGPAPRARTPDAVNSRR